ncbi:centromere protein P isoform X5 [Molossus molossus]|uniref:centromere protein P isoform X5 n=1 Tax=Molossus molossus TaxID=27622 RepID=UPI0017476196|nr:centromere protein P isoform X5 [Molossus molossus]
MSTEMTEKGIQRHKLSGNCQMITFQVEFQILEVQTKENLSTVITDLNIIMESTTYPELSEFVSRAEERRALFMFFRSLHCFVEWCEYQKRTFKHFKRVNLYLLAMNLEFILWKILSSLCKRIRIIQSVHT